MKAGEDARGVRSEGPRKLGLCVLCGLPAAGKSTLARALSHRLRRVPSAAGYGRSGAGPWASSPMMTSCRTRSSRRRTHWSVRRGRGLDCRRKGKRASSAVEALNNTQCGTWVPDRGETAVRGEWSWFNAE
ncbi:hypothetical protein CB1_001111002 [Camelus ferus]|nr:hypothetical protein CB1_001111002 [Camelus ferus]